jgi:exodeoxyribonuclease VII small subunit
MSSTPSHPPVPPDIAQLGFEDALAELETIVRTLEGGKSKLDSAIAAYERGVLLKEHCEAKLREAQMKIDRIVGSVEGGLKTAPADLG